MDDPFIATIVAAPGDDATRLSYADWLEQRGDPRGEYLRAEAAWARTRDRADDARLRVMAAKLDAVWVARVSRSPVGVCADHVQLRDPPDNSRPRLSASDLDWIEHRFAITLPPDYRAFMQNYNGGGVEPGQYRIPGRTYGNWEYEVVLGFGTVWAAAESESDWYEFDLVWNLQKLAELRADKKEPSKFPAQRKVDEETAQRWRALPHGHLMIIGFGPPSGELELVALGCGGPILGQVYLVSVPWATEGEQSWLIAPTFTAFLAMLTDYDPEHLKALKHGDLAALRRWLEAGGDPNERYHGVSLLNRAIWGSNVEITRELLAHGAEVNSSALADANFAKKPELVELLRSFEKPSVE
jgi:uncharacterized protein (TIGR02996 family)